MHTKGSLSLGHDTWHKPPGLKFLLNAPTVWGVPTDKRLRALLTTRSEHLRR